MALFTQPEQKHVTLDQARIVAEHLGITWKRFSANEFMRGMNVELEHGTRDAQTNVTNDDFLLTGKLALAHLKRFPDYYDRLEKMEAEAEKEWVSNDGKI